jgi:hypothetical protein
MTPERRRAFLLFLLMAVCLCWALVLGAQREARHLALARGMRVQRSRHFESDPAGGGRWNLIDADGSLLKSLDLDPGSPNWLQSLSLGAQADTPDPSGTLVASVEPNEDLLEIRGPGQVKLVDATLALITVFPLPEGEELRGGFRLSPDRSLALAETGGAAGTEPQLWICRAGAWTALALDGRHPLGDSLKVSPQWEYAGYEARGDGDSLQAVAGALASATAGGWASQPGWSLVGLEDDGTVHLAQADQQKDWQIQAASKP